MRIGSSWFHRRKRYLKNRCSELAAATFKITAWAVVVLWTCLAHTQIPAVNGMTFERVDSSLALVSISHSDEGKTPGFAAHSIGYNMNVSDGAVRREQITQCAFAHGEGEITHV
jgi:hypothetical protein